MRSEDKDLLSGVGQRDDLSSSLFSAEATATGQKSETELRLRRAGRCSHLTFVRPTARPPARGSHPE